MKIRNIGILLIALFVLIFSLVNFATVGATKDCDWYKQHPASSDHPNGWGECMTGTPETPTPAPTTETPTAVPTHCVDGHGDDNDHNKHCNPTDEPTQEVTSTPEPTVEPTVDPTQEVTPTDVPTEVTPTEVPTATETPVVPQTVPTPAKKSCERKCIYNLGGIPGTHAVTAVSPNGDGPYTWQVKFGNVWYDVYDCFGVVIETVAEQRGETSIVRLIVDGTAPTDPNDYRISGGAAAILFDDHTY